MQVCCGLFGLAGADDWHGRWYDSGRQPAEGLAGQGVHYGRGSGRAVGEELVQVLTDKVQVIECDVQIISFRRVVYHQFSADVDIPPCVLGQSLVTEALSAGGGQDVGRWLVLAFRFYRFGRNKALVDEGVDPVLVLPGGDSGGSVEEFGVASGTGDLGGGGGGLLAADQVHLLVGEAVEFDEHFAAREMAERAAGSSLPSRTWSMPVDTLSMAWRRRSGMRLSARAAVDEALPPRGRHSQALSAGAWAIQ